MLAGEAGNTESEFSDRVYLPKQTSITGRQWQKLVSEGGVYVWLDYFSVPQIGTYSCAEADDDLAKAVRSIPAYIENSTHFIVVCPTVQHRELHDTLCDYGSWMSRGWCRLELFALLMSRYSTLPAIVMKGGESAAFMTAPNSVFSNLPGHGRYTCCERNHTLPDGRGGTRTIKCDKIKIGEVVARMVQLRQRYHLEHNELHEYRIWLAFGVSLLSGLPQEADLVLPETVDQFLHEYKFESHADVEEHLGFTPLMYACLTGNVVVIRGLIERGADVHARTRASDLTLGTDIGMEALHFVLAVTQREVARTIQLLLDAGANPNAQTKIGATPLHASAGYCNYEAARALLQSAGDKLDLDRGIYLNNATPLGFACYLGMPEMVILLLEAGASVLHVNDHGGTKLVDATHNAKATPAMLEAIWNHGYVDLNCQMRSKTWKWKAIDKGFQKYCKWQFKGASHFVLEMAHAEGNTALGFAAASGHASLVKWLLKHGAHPSLKLKNKMGRRPIELARIFGPHPEVEAVLSGAAMDSNFHAQFLLRRGSIETRSMHERNSAGNSERPKAVADETSASDRADEVPAALAEEKSSAMSEHNVENKDAQDDEQYTVCESSSSAVEGTESASSVMGVVEELRRVHERERGQLVAQVNKLTRMLGEKDQHWCEVLQGKEQGHQEQMRCIEQTHREQVELLQEQMRVMLSTRANAHPST